MAGAGARRYFRKTLIVIPFFNYSRFPAWPTGAAAAKSSLLRQLKDTIAALRIRNHTLEYKQIWSRQASRTSCFPKVKLGKPFPGILLDAEVGKKFKRKQIKVTSKPKCGSLLIKQGEEDTVERIISLVA